MLAPDVALPPVPVRPTKAETQTAVSLLLEHYLGDFPFEDAASKAHTLAAILSPLVRRMVHGPTPLFLVSASGPGVGKSLLLSAISLVAGGTPAVPQPMHE